MYIWISIMRPCTYDCKAGKPEYTGEEVHKEDLTIYYIASCNCNIAMITSKLYHVLSRGGSWLA